MTKVSRKAAPHLLLILLLAGALNTQLTARAALVVGIKPNLVTASGRPFVHHKDGLSLGMGLYGGIEYLKGRCAILAKVNYQSEDAFPPGPTAPPLLDGTYDERVYGRYLFSDGHFAIGGEIRGRPFWKTIIQGAIGRVFRSNGDDITYLVAGLGVPFHGNRVRFILGGEGIFFRFPYLLFRRTYDDGRMIDSQRLGRFYEWRGAGAVTLSVEIPFDA